MHRSEIGLFTKFVLQGKPWVLRVTVLRVTVSRVTVLRVTVSRVTVIRANVLWASVTVKKKHLHHILSRLDVIRSAQDMEESRALAHIALDQGDLGLGGPRDVRHDLTVFPHLRMTVTMQDKDNVGMEGGENLPPQEALSGAPCR